MVGVAYLGFEVLSFNVDWERVAKRRFNFSRPPVRLAGFEIAAVLGLANVALGFPVLGPRARGERDRIVLAVRGERGGFAPQSRVSRSRLSASRRSPLIDPHGSPRELECNAAPIRHGRSDRNARCPN